MARWQMVAVVGVAAAVMAGCGPADSPLRVSAAVSLTESLTAAVKQWERETGERAALNFAASNVLARQIENGAPADVFISADAITMERLVVGRLVVAESVVALLSNQLVVVTSDGRPMPSPAPGGLADSRVARIALGDPAAVPAGTYARQWLERIGLWPAVAAKVVPTHSVRAALAAVESGNVDAAVIYRTDAVGRSQVRIEYHVPLDEGPLISYPGGIVSASRQPARAEALVSWLRGDTASSIFKAAGFTLPAGAATR